MSLRRTHEDTPQLELFHARPGNFAVRDAQDLMAYPFFSLAKSKRLAPIDFMAGTIVIRVEAVPEHGMATIWDADILIWAASQIVEARDAGLRSSRLMAATPYEILTFIGRGVGARDYDRLKAALDRLQSTTIATSIRQPTKRRMHRFSWINEWKERADHRGRPLGLELILPDWFYAAVLDDALVLTIDRAYFDLTGGLERWLYRLVRKHGGRQSRGWSFELPYLHAKSGSLSPLKHFAYDLREIVRQQALPGYSLTINRPEIGPDRLFFVPTERLPFTYGKRILNFGFHSGDNSLVPSGTVIHVPSATRTSCYRGLGSTFQSLSSVVCEQRNLSNQVSFGILLLTAGVKAASVDNRVSLGRYAS